MHRSWLGVALVAVFALAGTNAQPCTVADLLTQDGNYTILIKALQGAGLWENVQTPALVGTLLAPTDEAFGLALQYLAITPDSLATASGEALTALQGILTAHALTEVLPVLKTGTYATLEPMTKVALNADDYSAVAVPADGSTPSINLASLGFPNPIVGDDVGIPSCNQAAFVYPLEEFPLVPPSLILQLSNLG